MDKTFKDDPSGLISIVRRYFNKLHRRQLLALGLAGLSIFLAVLLAGLILEAIFYLPATAKTLLWLGALLCFCGAIFYLYDSRQLPNFPTFYRRFAKESDNPSLSYAIDLFVNLQPDKPAMQQAAIAQNMQRLDRPAVQNDLKDFVRGDRISRLLRTALVTTGFVILLISLTIIYQPQAPVRFAQFWVSFSPPNPYSFSVEPGDITLERGNSFTPEISFTGAKPEHQSIAFKSVIEDSYRHRDAVRNEGQKATFPPVSLSSDGEYYFEMDGYKTKKYRISVQLRPRFEQLKVEVIPPAYSKLDTVKKTYPFSKIKAYPGSRVQLSGTPNKKLKKLTLYRSALADSVALTQTKSSNIFLYSWNVKTADTLFFRMTGQSGLHNKNMFRFITEPVKDQYPFVELLNPAEDLTMKSVHNVELRYKAGDDFGLTGASLHYEHRRAFTSSAEKQNVSLSNPPMNKKQVYTWKIKDLKPKPRDVITYWIEVSDNDAIGGNKTSRSQKYTISIPSMTTYLDELDNREQDVSQSMDKVSDSFKKMEQEYDRFKQQLRRNPETNYRQKKQLETVKKQKDKVDKQVDELNRKFEEIRKEINKDKTLSPETMKAYDELQKLMKDIKDPELSKALKKLQDSFDKMSPPQLRDALQNYDFNEQVYKERIERTKELFKSLKLNSDLEKMARSMESMANQEKKISESNKQNSETLSRQQAVKKDLRRARNQLDELHKNAPEKKKDEVKKLQKDLSSKMDQTNRDVGKNIDQLQKEKGATNPKNRQQQRSIQKQMKGMAKQLRNAQKKMGAQQNKLNIAGVRYVLYSLINLSENQEMLTRETKDLPSRSGAFVEKAREQRNIGRQFTMLSDSLFQLSSNVPAFSNEINKKKKEIEQKISRAVDMLSERNESSSAFAQRQSLGGINDLASMLASLLDRLQQQSGKSGGSMSMQQMMKQMQQMSGRQRKLNQQIQKFINDMQGNRLSQSQQKRINQLSEQQNEIRGQLQKIQRDGSLESGDRIMSQLERMNEKMEQTINDIRGGQLDRQLQERQKNILSRMLSAEKAVQKRGKEDKRTATTAKNHPESVPPDVTLEELQQRIRKMLNDPEQTKFSEDYQRLIEQYFELLNEKDKPNDSQQ